MTWPTEQARRAVPCTRVCDDSSRRMHGMRHTSGCDEHRLAVLDALAAHVAALVRAERAAALREAADWLDSFEGPGGRSSAHDRAGRDIIRLIRGRAEAEEAGR